MELFIASLGGLVIAGLIVIAGIIIYILLNKSKSRNTTKQAGLIGTSKCPLCAGRMDVVLGAPYIIHCNTPKCPNYVPNSQF